MFSKTKSLMGKYINYNMAIAGATILGITVFIINYSHGIPIALVAASKQAIYTFLFGGLVTRLNENLSVKLSNAPLSIIFAACCSTCLAVSLTFIIHSLKGTPEPLYSTLPTLLLSIPGFTLLAWKERKSREAVN